MIKKLRPTGIKGVFVWKIALRLPTRRIHTHVELTEENARLMYSALLAERSHSRAGVPFRAPVSRMKLADACGKYLHELLMAEKNTVHINGVRFSLSLLREVAGDDLSVEFLTRDHVRLWRDKRQAHVHYYDKKKTSGKKAGPNTINKGLAHLSGFFSWCLEERLMEYNPAQSQRRRGKQSLAVKNAKPPMKILSWATFLTFVEDAWKRRPAFGLFVEVLGETGARVDELCRAKVGDVDLSRRTWTKTVKPGKVLVMDAEEWVLFAAQGRKPDEPLCPMENNKAFTYSVLKRGFTVLCKELNLKRFTPHAIRHGRACWELLEGKTVHQVKEKLGHSSVTVTETYLRSVEILRREEPAGVIHRHLSSVCQPCDKQRAQTCIGVHSRAVKLTKWGRASTVFTKTSEVNDR